MKRESVPWRVGAREFDCNERTLVMGILNVTPDSFADGGRYSGLDEAVKHGIQMAADGADFVDVGGESTRPGSDPIPEGEERDRVVPVIEALVAEIGAPISIDTRKAEVASDAVSAGATIVNDVSAGADPKMFGVVAGTGAAMVLMHMKGEPKTMQKAPHYDDVVAEVHEFLEERLSAAVAAGIEFERLCVDPGLGFGKGFEHNITLMRELESLRDLGRPILVGPSRKSFIGQILDAEVDERLEGTAGAVALLVERGANIVRVHDVREMVRVVRVVEAIARGR
ncbi:MAG: dihydropteroate synthase [Actinomycetota bacterium]